MAEIKPYSLIRSQRKTMFTRVKMSAEEEINRSVYTSVVRSRTETGNKRKNVLDVYAARRSKKSQIKFQVNTSFVFNRC